MSHPEASSPEVSVIIPHFNDLASLDRCLTAIAGQAAEFPFEIIVADNNSPCGQAAVEEVIAGRARLALALERGAGPARNAGVEASHGHLLAFTDCDCIPEPGWLAAGIDALSSRDFVGGAMTVLVDDPRNLSGAEAFERVFAFNNRRYVEEQGFTVTANLFCPRTVFDQVGHFRTGVSEDLEWCQRAAAAGFRIGYASNAVVGHPARADWAELVGKWRRLNVESYALFASRPGGRLRWALRSLLLPASIMLHVPAVIRSSAISGSATRSRALATLVRIRLWRLLDAWRLLLKSTS